MRVRRIVVDALLDLVTEVAKEGAVRLMELEPPLLALRIIAMGDLISSARPA